MQRHAIVLVTFAVMFALLAVSSYTQKSATWDEPQHLTTGYLMWERGDFRTDPEHPPFLRLWAALPLLALDDIKLETAAIDHIPPSEWVAARQFEFCHWFLYQQNDADRLLYRARFMIVLLGVGLGVMVFCWTRELLGFWPATIALGLYTLEPNILAHASLVTTDFGITCFMFGAVYFLWRWTQRPQAGNAAGFVAFTALSVVSKFTAVLLLPVAVVLLVVHAIRSQRALPAATLFGAAFVAAWIAVWAVYGFRYLPARSTDWRYRVQEDSIYGPRAPKLTTQLVQWADDHHLVPNAYAQGFLLGQIKAQARGAYLMGKISSTGWWYFFPAAFAMKTPVALLALLACGVVLCCRRWQTDWLFLLLPAVVVLGTAMSAKLNIGLRHILPIYPFLIVVAGMATGKLLTHPRPAGRVLLGALGVAVALESALIWPDYLAFFNALVGGPRQGSRSLVDSNLDWGQDLKPLKRWMDREGVDFINLSYFGTADAAYYGINCQHLPGAPFFNAGQIGPPRLPGFVAVSATNLRGVYADEATRKFYEPLQNAEPVAVIGHSIFVYGFGEPSR
jgi:hypothetical protein